MTFAYFSMKKSRASAARRTVHAFAKGSATPLGDYKLALNKILLPTFHHRKVTPPPGRRTVYAFAQGHTRRHAPTNPPLIRTTNPSFCFPIKPTIYTILAHYLPKM